MTRTFEIMIDLANPRQNIIVLKRGDERSSEIVFTIMNNGSLFDLSDAYLATVKGIKPDDTVIYDDAEIDTENSQITYTISDQVTTAVGKGIYEITIQDDNLGLITTFNFYISVENITFDETDYLSTNDLSAFRAYMQQTSRSAQETQRYVTAFRDAYGDEQELINAQTELYEYYENYLADLKSKVAAGYFTGARGERGEDGTNGVISDVGLVLGFDIQDGNLVVHYSDGALNFYIDGDGNLIVTEGE